jgi:hypothetical protein
MDAGKKADREDFSKGHEFWFRELDWARQNRRRYIADFAGTNYGRRLGYLTSPKNLLNLLQLMVVSLSVALVYSRPRVKITTDEVDNTGFADHYQLAINNWIKTLYVEEELRQIVLDSLFFMGIGMSYEDEKPFCRISPDNCVYDAGKGHLCRADFVSHRYRIPIEDARNDDRFDTKLVKKLKPSKWSEREDISDLTAGLTEGVSEEDGEIVEMVDLAACYNAIEKEVWFTPVYSKFRLETEDKPLYVEKFPSGRPNGPFRFLNMLDVPDNATPLSVVDSVHDLYRIVNVLISKLCTRAKKMRDIPTYTGGSFEDMQRIMFAPDLTPVNVKDKDGIGLMRLFGVDQGLSQFTYGLLELFKQGAGNLDDLVGLSPSADTLGQSEMISGKVNQRLAHYRQRVNKFTAEAMGDLAEIMWNDEELVVPGQMEVPGTKFNYDSTWYPEQIEPRQGKQRDYKPDIEPYSMEYKSPQMQFAAYNAGLQSVMPFLEAGMQQGAQFDFQEHLKVCADLLDSPYLKRAFKFGAMPPPQQEPGAGQKPNEPHKYIRENVSHGQTSNGAIQQAWGQQPHEGNGQAAMTVE